MKKIGLAVLVLFLFLHSHVYADSLILKDGTKLDGTVREETPEWIVFEVYGGTVKFYRSEIDRIEKNDLGSTPEPASIPTSIPSAVDPQPNGLIPITPIPETTAPPKSDGSYKSTVKGMFDGAKAELDRFNAEKAAEELAKKASQVKDIPEVIKNITGFLPHLEGEGWDRVRAHVNQMAEPKPINPDDTDALLRMGGRVLLAFIVTSLALHIYLRIFRSESSFLKTAGFLFKYNMITNLLLFLSSKIPGTSGPGEAVTPSQTAVLGALGLSVLIFFLFAKWDFDSGFFKSIGLFVLMIVVYSTAELTCAYFGFLI